jgi:hypothetical protein
MILDTDLKTCHKCRLEKPLSDFFRSSQNSDGRGSWCKVCSSAASTASRRLHPERNVAKVKEWRKSCPDKHKGQQKRKAARVLQNPIARLIRSARKRTWDALGKSKSKRTFQFIGILPQYWKFYLECTFKPGMTWENYGTHWQIDHITPVAVLKEDPSRVEEIFHYTNTQALSVVDNIKKGAKV